MSDFDKNPSSGVNPPASHVKPLFRQQAVEFANTRQYGTVILSSYVGHQFLTILFSTIAVAIIVFFFLFSTARKAQTSGIVLPSEGLLRVRAGQTGIVRQVRVREGQKVAAGDVLFVLSSERNIGTVESAENTVSTLLQDRRDSYRDELLQSNRQANQRVWAAQKRSIGLREEGERLNAQIVLQKSRIALVTQGFQRFKDLHAKNYISEAQMEEKEGDLLDQRQRLVELERLRGINERERTSSDAEYQDLQFQAKRDETALKRNALAIQQDLVESEARREIYVTAAIPGVISAITVDVGKPVTADTTLTSILPNGSELAAEIYAPSRSIGFIKPGMTVRLRYQAYPYQKFGQYEAVVREVAGTSISAQELTLPSAAASPNQSPEPLYRIRLKLKQQSVLAYGKPVSLKPGMLLDATIILEHRRLYEWVLEPLFSISGRG